MEPAVKPAAERTNSGIVGVLATPATFQGDLYSSVVERFASGVKILDNTCPGLVSQIEKGLLDDTKTRAILERALNPMLSGGIDTVVLGCTHYPFVIPIIEEIAGPGVRVINPAPAVARQVRRLLDENGLRKPNREMDGKPPVIRNNTRIQTSGDPVLLEALLPTLLDQNISVSPILWQDKRLRPPR
jgi:glutamate racemase